MQAEGCRFNPGPLHQSLSHSVASHADTTKKLTIQQEVDIDIRAGRASCDALRVAELVFRFPSIPMKGRWTGGPVFDN